MELELASPCATEVLDLPIEDIAWLERGALIEREHAAFAASSSELAALNRPSAENVNDDVPLAR